MTPPPITPVPVPTVGDDRPESIIVFGGTFDPPHVGHVRLPERVRDELEHRTNARGRCWLLYVPAARSPLKTRAPIASDDERAEMLRLAISETPRAAVWTDEIDRASRMKAEPSYTIDTLSRLRTWLDDRGLAGTRVRLLIGADQALSFHSWRQPRDILRVARPLVMIRGEAKDAESLGTKISETGFWDATELAMWRDAIMPVGRIEVSATQVRSALASNEAELLANLLPAIVLEYIRQRGIYVNPPA